MVRYFAATLGMVILAGGATAEDWRALNGAEISQMLIAHDLEYGRGETQDFRASGRTLYTAAEPSWGNWRVEGDRYCSQWPPGRDWDCYDVAFDGDRSIRFIDDWGNVSIGVFRP